MKESDDKYTEQVTCNYYMSPVIIKRDSKKMDSISYVYISWTIYGMWMIYITFETGGPKFPNTTARALA